jgi:arylsulfatase A-like enzyme
MCKQKGKMFFTLVIVLMALSCSGPESDQRVLTAEMPLHLEEHLDDAKILGSEVPADVPKPVEWRFDEPQPDWKPAGPIFSEDGVVRLEGNGEALKIHFSEANRGKNSGNIIGAIYIDLPDWHRDDWGSILISARNSDHFFNVRVFYNLGERMVPNNTQKSAVLYGGDITPLISDGEIHTYELNVNFEREEWGEWKDPWKQLILYFAAPEPASIEILSVNVVPKEFIYADTPTGVKTIERSKIHRRTLYTHAPGRIEYRVKVPESGRLDFGAGVIKVDSPVSFKVIASQKAKEITLFKEAYADPKEWRQHSVDLSSIAGKTVTLALEADAERSGSVALWSAPTLTGKRSTHKPNIIFYVIDGAGADLMSVYGCNRRTTPNLERLAAEGALFENAYSNCTWTKVSNSSFMTSLYQSVLGGYKSDSDPLPDQAMTMAQHLHRAGYQTAVLVSNSYAGTMSSFDRGVDVLREEDIHEKYSVSSNELQEQFWRWREAYPCEPYWVHFQTTDVHGPSWKAVAPFAGLFISPELRQRFYEWQRQMSEAGSRWGRLYSDVWEKTGISPQAFSQVRKGLYDENMAHNDYQIGQLVRRLKAAGEWNHTLLIISADHAHQEAGLIQLDPLPPKWGSPLFASFRSRIPMIFVWPERIAPGQRFSQPVSLIDMLPTVLDFADLPMPELMQGQSLAPLLLGESGWESRPIILDECYVDRENGELKGYIEVVDGQWGASLEINGGNEYPEYVPQQRPEPMLLFDIWDDPYCLVPLNDQYPELVKKYTKFLEERWEAHQTLAKYFTRSKDSPLTSEQLKVLRALGYIR